MSKEAQAAERAEFIQSVKALLIPLSLFLACVIMAAGTFLIYNAESCGWGFVAVSTVMVISAFVALIRFQNKYRVRGIIKSDSGKSVPQSRVEAQPSHEESLLVFDPEKLGVAPKPSASTSFAAPGAVPKVTEPIVRERNLQY